MITLELPAYAHDWPHVTDILGIRWGESDFRDSQGGAEVFAAKGELGKQFHALVHANITHEDAEIWPKDAIVNRFNAWKAWSDQNVTEYIAVELPVWSRKFKYHGKIDALALMRSGGLGLPDWKNAVAMLPSYDCQLAAYKNALIEMLKDGVFDLVKLAGLIELERILVKITEETAKSIILPARSYTKDLSEFLQLLAVARSWKVKFKPREED